MSVVSVVVSPKTSAVTGTRSGRSRARVASELVVDHLRARPPLRQREGRLAHETRLVREADVVELDFREAEVHRFARELGGVLPWSRLVRRRATGVPCLSRQGRDVSARERIAHSGRAVASSGSFATTMRAIG